MFRTELHPTAPGFKLEPEDKILTLGSCFAEVIGERMQENKFAALANPFGVIFHPSICVHLLQLALAGETPARDTFLQREGRWLSYLLHSSIHAPTADALQKQLQLLFSQVNQQLRKSRVLMLTSGTAFLYVQEEMGLGVANCHKQPQKLFTKKLSTLEELNNRFDAFYQDLKAANPGIKIILTVSPVRHLKDSLELNTVSKSTLRLHTHQLCEKYPDLYYFPSYELLLDDLRDYRFYGRDLLHPSQEAEDYIWQKFSTTFFSERTQQFLKEWEKIRRALSHRPFNPASEAHQQFIRKTIHKLEDFPYQVDTSNEVAQLKSQLL